MPVNTGHSIGQYARFVLRASEGTNELLNGTSPSSGISTGTAASGDPALIANNAWPTWVRTDSDLDPVGSNQSITVFWYGEAYTSIEGWMASYTGGGYGWRFQIDPWTTNQSLLRFLNHFNPSGSGSASALFSLSDGAMKKFTIRYDRTSGTADLFVDGTLIGNDVSIDLGANAPTGSPGVSLYNSSTGSSKAKLVTLQIFEGALSDSNIATLNADPFAIFSAPSHNLAGGSSSQVNSVPGAGVALAGNLSGGNCTQSNQSLAAQVTRNHDLTGGNLTQVNASPSISVNPYTRLRSILDPLPMHTWVKVNLNEFVDAVPASSDTAAVPGNPKSIIYAWSSFAWDHANGNLILFGGGHANYKGNEVYIWNAQSGLWSRGSLPSKLDESDTELLPVISKDAPQSSHTYQNNVFLKNNKMFATFGGAATPMGGPFQELVTASPRVIRRVGPWVFDVTKADPNKVGGADGTGYDVARLGSYAWQHRRDMVDGTYPIDSANHADGAAVYVDEGGKDVVYFTMDTASMLPKWYRYEFGNIRLGERDTCSQVGDQTAAPNLIGSNGWMAFDTSRGFVYRGSASDAYDNPSYPGTYTAEIAALRKDAAWNVPPTGIQVVDTLGNPFKMNVLGYAAVFYGCVYDSINDVLWLWDAGTSDSSKPGRVWYITIPAWNSSTGWASTTWVATEINPAGSKPHGKHNQAVLGKIKHIPEVGAFVVIDGAQEVAEPGVWMFKTTELATVISGGNCTQGNISSAASVAHIHGITADASNQGNVVTGSSVSQTHELLIGASNQGNVSAGVSLTQTHQLGVASSNQSNVSAATGISQVHELTQGGNSQANVVVEPAISLGSGVNNLTIVGCTQSQTVPDASIEQIHSLATAASTQGNVASSDAITQVVVLVVSTTVQSNIAEGVAVSETKVLVVGTTTQANTVEAPQVTVYAGFVVSGSFQANVTPGVAITLIQTIVVEDLNQVNQVSDGSTARSLKVNPRFIVYAYKRNFTARSGE